MVSPRRLVWMLYSGAAKRMEPLSFWTLIVRKCWLLFGKACGRRSFFSYGCTDVPAASFLFWAIACCTSGVFQIASFDFYENRYKILKGETLVGEYAAEEEFLDAFFSLSETELGEIEVEGSFYLLARVRMMPVKIIAPLNIITLFSTDTVFTTPWVEAELKP
jgi:hypothetical protein